MSQEERYWELADKWLRGEITPEEAREYADWYNQDDGEAVEVPSSFAAGRAEHEARMMGVIASRAFGVRKMYWRFAAAAAVVALIGGAVWLYKGTSKVQGPVATVVREPLAPGRNKATLILADKKEVVLDDANRGEIARQGEAQVMKTDSGEIAYDVASNHSVAGGLNENTILTPRGGQYRLRLADGTTVFLNAQSSLRFPASFDGQERKVFLQGEAYFDVAPDAGRPFRVVLGTGQEITVLGTRFDVRDYLDDSLVAATLLTGSIRVESGSRQVVMAPSERAEWKQDGGVKVGKDDMAEASIAWTRGLFRFRNASLADVMRQLSRWYDVDVVFEGKPPAVPITASISRNTSAWEVLGALKEIAGLQYRVEGRKIIVLK